MDVLEVESSVCGHHVYMQEWTPFIGEKLECQREEANEQDPYAVAIVKRTAGRRTKVVGHVPRRILAACSLFLQRSGNIKCTITGARCDSSDLPQGGLEVPCILHFSGDAKLMLKITKLLKLKNERIDKSDTSCDGVEKDKVQQLTKSEMSMVFKEVHKPIKIINVDHGEVKNDSPQAWLSLNCITLTNEDKEIIQMGGQLNDKHMNFAQILLKQQFSNIQGLYSTLLLFRQKKIFVSARGRNVLQIIHTRQDHWIVASTIGCNDKEVCIYDSLFTSLDCSTKKLMSQLFGEDAHTKMQSCPKQQGGNDCGLFTIAVCTALAYGVEPTTFNQPAMRSHLPKCFEQQCLAVFP